jgi:hypothetical protein
MMMSEKTQKTKKTTRKDHIRKKMDGEWIFQQTYLPEKYRFILYEIRQHIWRETGVRPSVNDIVVTMFDHFYSLVQKGSVNENDHI